MAPRIELLEARHGREDFDCGNAALNDFLLRRAGQQQRRGFGKTYVVLADNGVDIIGFVTVSVGQVEARALPSQLKLPRHPAPMLRIGRLAVDKRAQGKGIGRDLLAFALHLALEFAERVGLYAVVVDAKDAQAAEFYQRLHFEPTLDDTMCLFLPLSRLAKTKTP
ncbi:GNAT family N-acetyltransferase [Sulfuritalea sp.]|uniref:GNAT family N-acetyltransferase n=1 Tax=Sulfuritalea sp. TaxID=2480090 RepID=UPI00286E0384|nr:GNAT family N-acetyltransferase [Sulfuritalea sp.]